MSISRANNHYTTAAFCANVIIMFYLFCILGDKIFAKNKKESETLILTIRIFSYKNEIEKD